MALITVSIDTEDFGGKLLNVVVTGTTGSGTVGDPYIVNRANADQVLFDYAFHLGAGSPTIVISSFEGSTWSTTNNGSATTANINLAVNGSASRYASSALTADNDDTINISATGYTAETIVFRLIPSVDNTADPFNLGVDQTNLQPGSLPVSLGFVTVAGINTPVTASITNGLTAVKASTPADFEYSTLSKTVVAGDRIYVKGYVPDSYNAFNDVTLDINGTSDTLRLTTKTTADTYEFIPYPDTILPTDLNTVGDFFGRPELQTYTDLNDYLKTPGGIYVPNITENAAIPTALPIDLNDFLGSGTSLYFIKFPRSKDDTWNSAGGAHQLAVNGMLVL